MFILFHRREKEEQRFAAFFLPLTCLSADRGARAQRFFKLRSEIFHRREREKERFAERDYLTAKAERRKPACRQTGFFKLRSGTLCRAIVGFCILCGSPFLCDPPWPSLCKSSVPFVVNKLADSNFVLQISQLA